MVAKLFADRDVVYRAGETADAVYRIQSGRVVLRRDEGDPGGITLESGDIFGAEGLITGAARFDTAFCTAPTEVDLLSRETVMSVLDSDVDALRGLLNGLFAADRLATEAAERAAAEAAEAAAREAQAAARELRLIPDQPDLERMLQADMLAIDRLPFCVGRRPGDLRDDDFEDVDLVLDDSRPYQLSRRHFQIEEQDNDLFCRDCGSYHGTIVNGVTIGIEQKVLDAPLVPGENLIVAGSPQSMFRFRLVVE